MSMQSVFQAQEICLSCRARLNVARRAGLNTSRRAFQSFWKVPSPQGTASAFSEDDSGGSPLNDLERTSDSTVRKKMISQQKAVSSESKQNAFARHHGQKTITLERKGAALAIHQARTDASDRYEAADRREVARSIYPSQKTITFERNEAAPAINQARTNASNYHETADHREVARTIYQGWSARARNAAVRRVAFREPPPETTAISSDEPKVPVRIVGWEPTGQNVQKERERLTRQLPQVHHRSETPQAPIDSRDLAVELHHISGRLPSTTPGQGTGDQSDSNRSVSIFDNIQNSFANKPSLTDDYDGFADQRRESIRRHQRTRREQKFSVQSTPYKPASEASRDKDQQRAARRKDQFVSEYEQSSVEAQTGEERSRERRRAKKLAAQRANEETPPQPIHIPDFISVSQLAQAMRILPEAFLWKMREVGFENVSSDTVINAENAGLLAMEYNFEPIMAPTEAQDVKARPQPKDQSALPSRPPVVTIMGHVDHGKTTLLDFLRKSSVVASEHGGITQHIGAFSVSMPSGRQITFLDTPGHAAFLSMRKRGANVTDIIVLVVAADDSVKPQTIEAIKHAKDAGVPMIVAVNKMDKPGSNPEKVKQDLMANGVEVEDFGGDTQAVMVSGKTGLGVQELEDAIIALSDTIDVRAERTGGPEGWVIEASTKAEGRVAMVLVRSGTLRLGDIIVAGETWARVRRIRDEAGGDIEAALPGTPVEVDGWRDQPVAGDEVLTAKDESHAKDITDYRRYRAEKMKLALDVEAINESRRIEHERHQREKENKRREKAGEQLIEEENEAKPQGPRHVKFIVKGDVSGSVEAVVNSITSIGNDEVQVQILRSGVGPISEFDVEHAATAQGFLISFNVPVDPQLRQLAGASGIQILDHNVIYRLQTEVKETASKFLAPLVTKKVLGEAEIARVFDINLQARITKAIAGCKVRNGVISRNAKIRVIRGGDMEKPVYEGHIEALKNVKKDVEEMRKGSECGISFVDWDAMEVGDKLQTFEEITEERSL